MKTFKLFLAILLIVVLAGCGSDSSTTSTTNTSNAEKEGTILRIENALKPLMSSTTLTNEQKTALEGAFASWDSTETIFSKLAKEYKVTFAKYVIANLEKTNEMPYIVDKFVCLSYASLTYANISGDVDFNESGDWYFSGYTFTFNAVEQKFRLPIYVLQIYSGDYGHSVNAILVGDSVNDLNSWYMFEPQGDWQITEESLIERNVNAIENNQPHPVILEFNHRIEDVTGEYSYKMEGSPYFIFRNGGWEAATKDERTQFIADGFK